MAASTNLMGTFRQIGRRGIVAPVAMLIMLGMMMLPLPPFMLDLLFTFNIALSLVILLATMYVMRPLELASFPTVVLFATLLRLALNIASTRVVLLHGHNGPAPRARSSRPSASSSSAATSPSASWSLRSSPSSTSWS